MKCWPAFVISAPANGACACGWGKSSPWLRIMTRHGQRRQSFLASYRTSFILPPPKETFAKRPLLANPPLVTVQVGVRLKFQSSKYLIYSCGWDFRLPWSWLKLNIFQRSPKVKRAVFLSRPAYPQVFLHEIIYQWFRVHSYHLSNFTLWKPNLLHFF